MKKKLIIILPVVLLLGGAGAAYGFVLGPKGKPAQKKIAGAIVPLEKEFLVNLSGGHYGKVQVAVVVDEANAAAGGGAGHGAEGGLVQEAAVRALITDQLTGLDRSALINRRERKKILKRLVKAIHHETDEHVAEVLFTDITIQ